MLRYLKDRLEYARKIWPNMGYHFSFMEKKVLLLKKKY